MRIGNKDVGENYPCFIVAEIGINHNGDVGLAKRLIDEAFKANVDAVKFQKRNTESLLTKSMLNKPYVSDNSFGSTYGEHRNKLELSDEDWESLSEYSKNKGLEFFASAWDVLSVDKLYDLNVCAYKITSSDVTNLPLIEYVVKKGKPIILSTGMSTVDEIDEAVFLIRKYTDDLILLHCVSSYPCEDSRVNLRVINTLRERYKVLVGYSGHEKSGYIVSLGAVSLGACLIERHFTVDRTLRGTDHAASLNPEGLTNLVANIRKFEASLGDGYKKILDEEVVVRNKLVKSLVASRDIKKGDVLKIEDLDIKCNGEDVKTSPKYIDKFIGVLAKDDIYEGDSLPLWWVV